VFLAKVMVRRTHQDTLMGAKLLNLLRPSELTVWLEFNEIEKAIYEIIKRRFIQRINCISKSAELEKQYSHIWTMVSA
jgi:TATA-binding protein-associated factor Taf7